MQGSPALDKGRHPTQRKKGKAARCGCPSMAATAYYCFAPAQLFSPNLCLPTAGRPSQGPIRRDPGTGLLTAWVLTARIPIARVVTAMVLTAMVLTDWMLTARLPTI